MTNMKRDREHKEEKIRKNGQGVVEIKLKEQEGDTEKKENKEKYVRGTNFKIKKTKTG